MRRFDVKRNDQTDRQGGREAGRQGGMFRRISVGCK